MRGGIITIVREASLPIYIAHWNSKELVLKKMDNVVETFGK